jgi:hypothetical protein
VPDGATVAAQQPLAADALRCHVACGTRDTKAKAKTQRQASRQRAAAEAHVSQIDRRLRHKQRKPTMITRKAIVMVSKVVSHGLLVFVLTMMSASCGSNNGQPQNIESVANEVQTQTQPISLNVGDVLHTEYFDVKVNSVKTSQMVDTGNEYLDLKPESGIKYLIMSVSFKNIDKESRMIIEGSVWVNYNGTDYEFDQSETLLADGWGLFLDQINPLITKTTKLVYKIPAELAGPAFYNPGRSEASERIFLGNIQ